MAPKPRPIRKASTTAGGKSGPSSTLAQTSSMSMPPPPVPGPPERILEREVKALETIYKNAIVKTAQLHAQRADTLRLGLGRHAPYPSRTLVQSLGHEIEKYDQLCDSIEFQLNRAIATIQRDINREEQRLKQEEAKKMEVLAKTPAASPIISTLPIPSVPPSPMLLAASSPKISPPLPGIVDPTSPVVPKTPLARRPSTASSFGIIRSSRPLMKLNMPPPNLQLPPGGAPEEQVPRALGSPVTLAPKSARPLGPGELPEDFLNSLAGTDSTIDLTIDNETLDLSGLMESPHMPAVVPSMDTSAVAGPSALGNSADQPIELDFDVDMPNLFGDNPTGEGGDVPDLGLPPTSTESNIPLPSMFDATSAALDAQSSQMQASTSASASDMLQTLTQSLQSNPTDDLMQQSQQDHFGMNMATGATSPASLISAMQQQGQQQQQLPQWDMGGMGDLSQMGDFGAFGQAGQMDMGMNIGMGGMEASGSGSGGGAEGMPDMNMDGLLWPGSGSSS